MFECLNVYMFECLYVYMFKCSHVCMLILRLLLFPATVFFVSLAFLAAGFFEVWPWLDIPFHILGGLAIGVSGRTLLSELVKRRLFSTRRWWLTDLFILSLVALLAVLWEVYELILGLMFGVSTQLGVTDTVTDQIFGLTGGAISIAISHLASLIRSQKK